MPEGSLSALKSVVYCPAGLLPLTRVVISFPKIS